MMKAHDRYNRLFRQTHKTFQIHHLALLMLKDYITILVGTLQRIHRQYIRYELHDPDSCNCAVFMSYTCIKLK